MKHRALKNCRKQKTAEGYILLLTLLVISILLAISFGLYTIGLKEVVLSSFLRDSEKALVAADHGAECALFWDRSYPQNGMPYTIFATGTAYENPASINNASCAGMQLYGSPGWNVTVTAATGTTAFSLDFSDGTCVDVTIVKSGDQASSIVSDGYNSCDVSLPRRTQREISVYANI